MDKIVSLLKTNKIKITEKIKKVIEELIKNPLNDENSIIIVFKNYIKSGNKNFEDLLLKETYLRYRNLREEILPDYILSENEDFIFEIKHCYSSVMLRCCGILDEFKFKRNDILEKIYYYMKKKNVPSWIIEGVCEMNRAYLPLTPVELYSLIAKEELFLEQCRELWKRVNVFFKNKGEKNLENIIGVKIK